MEKVKHLLTKLVGMNLAYTLILSLLVKALISDISYATFLVTVPVLAFEGYKLFLKSKKPDPVQMNEEMRREIESVKGKLSALSMEKNVKQQNQRYF